MLSKIKPQQGQANLNLIPFPIKTVALDSIIKQSIFEANLFYTEDKDLIKIYEDHKKIVVPLLQRIIDIEKVRLDTNNPGLDEEEEHHTLNLINSQDAKLPRLDALIDKIKKRLIWY